MLAQCLGLVDDAQGRLALAAQRWAAWAEEYPALGVLEELRLGELRRWLYAAHWRRSDALLRALVRLSDGRQGEEGAAAATVVAWALLPGAIAVAQALRTMSGSIDELVAGALWLEIRTFDTSGGQKVAAGILRNTRGQVLLELGAHSQLERVDRAWSQTVLVDDPGALPQPGPDVPALGCGAGLEPGVDPAEELRRLLTWARARGVITDAEESLLLRLVGTVRHLRPRYCHGGGGLLTDRAAEAVARQLGTGSATVKRHARQSMRALAAAGNADDAWRRTA